MSPDAVVAATDFEIVEKFVAASRERARTAHVDEYKIYTNEFAREH